MINDGMFTSKTDMWETPQDLFDNLDSEFHFTLDVCAVKENAKCKNFYSPEQDGLSQPWTGRVWCNPPYGRQIGKWVRRALFASAEGATVVMLLPARTDTKWFHEYIYHKAEIRFIRGRLKFGGAKNGAPFPKIYGWPFHIHGVWCNSDVKMPPLLKIGKWNIQYIGIAADEPSRFHNLSQTKKSPLVEAGWDEAYCRQWCEENGLLSPIYTTATRGGCWFCHNQGVDQLRLLRKNYPDLWALMLKWDNDSPVSFKPDGHTVHDFDARFALEDEGFINAQDRFSWSMLEHSQIGIDYYLKGEAET